MKNIYRKLFVGLVLAAAVTVSVPVQADPPGMPGNHGAGGNQIPGGGAPVGSGLLILMGLGGAYAGKKYLNNQE